MEISIAERQGILNILKQIPLNEYSNFSTYNYYFQYLKEIEGDINHLHKGVSKVAIELANYPDWIIKIPFNGTHIDEEEYELLLMEGEVEEGEEIFDEENEAYFIPFSHAFDNISWEISEGWNYCEVENRIYDWAEKEKLEQFFIKTEYIGDINGYPIYVQLKVSPWETVEIQKDTYNITQEIQEQSILLRKEYKNYKPFWSFFEDWYEILLSVYNLETILSLCNFILENELSDFHSENFGINIKNNNPVFFDYCGFRDSQSGLTDYDSEF